MAWQIPIANTNSSIDIGALNSIYIAKPIVVGEITGSGSNQHVIVDGTVADSYGIFFSNGAGTGNVVTISSTGIIRALDSTAISLYSFNSTVNNDGHVYGNNLGVLFYNVSQDTTSTLNNNGTIEGNTIGIGRYFFSTETISIINTGVISGKSYSYGKYSGDSLGIDLITNKGTMNGAVDLGGGNDVLDTSLGRIIGAINGGGGDDTLIGSAYGNHILGGDGNDTIKCGAGNDTISGGTGNDYITGKGGNDSIIGGTGRDRIYGGTGADTFALLGTSESGPGNSRDVIYDFKAAEGDKLDLRAIDADAAAAGNQAFGFIGTAAFTHHAGELRYQASGADLIVFGDVNGDGTADFSVQLKNLASLTAGAFFL